MAVARRLAGITISDGTNDLGIITDYDNSIEINFEDTSGFNDTVGDPPIIRVNNQPVDINETLEFSGISTVISASDNELIAGQSAIKVAAASGTELTLQFRFEDGHGYDYTGFLSNYSASGSRGDKSEKFSCSFMVNDSRTTNT